MPYSKADVTAIKMACGLSTFVIPLLSTMMNLSLVNIGEEFGVGSHDLAYVNTAFLLTSVIFMVPLAKIGDIIGKKKLFLIGLAIMAGSCVVGAIAPGFWFVILSRVLTGIGAGAIATVNMALITDVVPPETRGAAIGIQAMFTYIGLSVGPALGGVLNDLLGWRFLFTIIVLLTAVCMLVLLRFSGEIRPDAGGRFDYKGAVLYGFSALFMMMGVIKLPSIYAIASIVLGFALLILFVRTEKRTEYCLLKMKLFKNRTFSGSCIAAFVSYASSYCASFFLALYLQNIGALSATEAGLLLLIQPAIQAVGTPLCGKLSDRLSNKALLPTLGMAVTAVGTLMFTMLSVDISVPFVVLTTVVMGIGFSLFSAPNMTVIMSSVPMKETNAASGMVAVMRQSGMTVSMGVAMMFIALIMGSTDNLGPETYGLFVDVIRTTFTLFFVLCIIGTIASAFRGSNVNVE